MKAILILLAILAFEQGYCSHDSFTGLNLDKYPCKPEYLRVSIVTIVGFIPFFVFLSLWTKNKKKIGHFLAFSLFVTSNYQTMKFVSPILSKNLSQLEQLKEKGNFLLFFSQFPTNEKISFFFISLNWEKFVEQIGENKIRDLVVWCHE